MKPRDLRTLLSGCRDEVLQEAVAAWARDGDGNASKANGDQREPARAALLARLAAAMEDEARVGARLLRLPNKLQNLLEAFFAAPGFALAPGEVFAAQARNWKSRFDLEACLAALQREGLLFAAADKRWHEFGGAGFAVPQELAKCVVAHRQRARSALRDVITLQGFLDARHFRGRAAAQGGDHAPGGQNGGGSSSSGAAPADEHARKIYKLYALPSSIVARRAKLPAGLQPVVASTLLRHGGLAAWAELAHELGAEAMPDAELVKKCLETAMLGTVVPLPLARFGIQPAESAMVLFTEVVHEELRRHADTAPPSVQESLACGGDFASNVSRFLRELQQSKVLFTADGELFKASHKRIAGQLLPVPGGFLLAEPLLELIYRFCLHRRFIDRRGERALRPTPQGQEFERAPLPEQQKVLLQHFVEDRTLPGEPFHHVRMRRVLLKTLRKAVPMQWYDLSMFALLARNAYLAQLDGMEVEQFFAARFQGTGYTPTETLQQMAWNLVLWQKRRLYPLGLVDLGLASGRPTAMRLSQFGADLLAAEPASKQPAVRSTVIVNPDFEVLLFPGDDVHEAVHALDRFARRLKSDHVHQFKLEQETVRQGIAEGVTVEQMLRELQDRARAPLPQNVLYSLEEWSQRS